MLNLSVEDTSTIVRVLIDRVAELEAEVGQASVDSLVAALNELPEDHSACDEQIDDLRSALNAASQRADEAQDVLKRETKYMASQNERLRRDLNLLEDTIQRMTSGRLIVDSLPDDAFNEAHEHVKEHKYIQAIKTVRTHTGLGLKASKAAIDDYWPAVHGSPREGVTL